MTQSAFTVLVPTYLRPKELSRCLAALEAQSRPATQVVVVFRTGDDATEGVLNEWSSRLPLAIVGVNESGVVAAMNAGLVVTDASVVAITDDDAAPHRDWLARLEPYFDDPSVAGVGGRDVMWHDGAAQPAHKRAVGRVQWCGRVIGNHHLGVGDPRDVDVLKGVNCAYRREMLVAVGFDSRLRGPGAQVHWELSLGLTLRRSGCRLVYDPAILVDHFEAPRAEIGRVSDARTAGAALSDASYNETLSMLDHLGPGRRRAFFLWAELIGTRASPGVAQVVRLMPGCGLASFCRWRAALAGRADARRDWIPDNSVREPALGALGGQD